MVFNSVIFIFCFLPIFLLIYYFVPARARNPVLFAGSLFFYAWGDPTYLVLMLFSSFFNYYMGKELGKITDEDPSRKRNLIFAVVINLLILGFFKYWGFLLDTVSGVTGLKLTYPQLALPIGLSFYTFKNLSYILDIYMGKTEPCKGFFPYAVYSTMFPHMTAGPIVRYTDISESISRRSINTTRLGAGAELFIKGLSKKVLLADNLSALYTTLQASGTTSFVGTWLAIGAYTLELYFDFSGYSDMAIGLGRFFGFHFQENFRFPYSSLSVSEFWRRWHISLGSWFREYLYFPLGGSRKGNVYLNLFVVFLITGIWHGSSLIYWFWGIAHGLCVMIERYISNKKWYSRIPKVIKWFFTFFVVSMGWIVFQTGSFTDFKGYIKDLLGLNPQPLTYHFAYFLSNRVLFLIFICAVCLVLLGRKGVQEKLKKWNETSKVFQAVKYVGLCVLFALSLMGVVSSTYSPFIYFQF